MKKLIGASLCLLVTTAMAEINFSKKVNQQHIDTLKGDIQNLKSLDLNGKTTKAFKNIFASQKVKGDALNNWLNERVQFIVEQDFLESAQIRPLEEMSQMVNHSLKNDFEIERTVKKLKGKDLSSPDTYRNLGINEIHSSGQSGVVMSNLGTAIYYLGKQNNVVVGVDFETVDDKVVTLPVTSPRSGLIQIGPVLFSPRFLVDPSNTEAKVNSYNRSATLLHEARHSDGNSEGESLGFLHNNCPAGHDLEGAPACDFNGNGPYAVGGVFMYEVATKCGDDCSEADKGALKARAFDSFSRVMKVNGKLTFLDSAPEGERVENR